MMSGWGMIGGMGWPGMFLGGLFCLAMVALVIWGLLRRAPAHPAEPDAVEILNRRYAHGEITRAQFEEAQAALR